MKLRFNKAKPTNECNLTEEDLILNFDDEPLQINDEPCVNCANTDDDFSIGDVVSTPVTENEIRNSQDMFYALIQDEQAAIAMYNNFLQNIQDKDSPFAYLEQSGVSKVIKDIISEENKHIGQLQYILNMINPDNDDIKAGQLEAARQLANYSMSDEEDRDVAHPFFNAMPQDNMKLDPEISSQMKVVDGIRKLPVQSMNYVDSKMNTESNTSNECSLDDACSVSNADDEF